ncbi:MAG: ABC transporter ATP-binding protein, partial [bacterium]|nr:ABC transporter ATP-binding protein [bacterium]
RLRIQAQKDLPNPLPIDGMVNCSVDGPTAVVTVDGLEEEAIPALEKRISAVIDVEYLNLEDIFLELNK